MELVDLWANPIPGSSSSQILTYLDMQLGYMLYTGRNIQPKYAAYGQHETKICQSSCIVLLCCDLVLGNVTRIIQKKYGKIPLQQRVWGVKTCTYFVYVAHILYVYLVNYAHFAVFRKHDDVIKWKHFRFTGH